MKLVWFLLCVVATGATEVEFPRNSFGDTFTNMAVHGGNLYIGARNSIYILKATDLTESQDKVSTCTGECNNINKVLLVNKKLGQLITCGTDHGGTCEIRSLTSVKDVIRRSTNTSEEQFDYLVLSSSEKRPATFVLTESANEVYAGVTFGPGVKSDITVSFNSFFYYLSTFSLASNKYNRDKFLKVQLNVDPQSGTNIQLEEYVVYHKGGFEVNGFVYFVTNQKFKAGDTHYISKLIRVCQNDTSFWSYTDIKLACEKDGVVYNLIQDVSVFEPGEELRKKINSNEKIMAATFATGSDPESPELPSAVCLYKMEDVDRKIMEAKRNFITCPYNRLSEKESYLRNNLERCLNNSNYNGEYVKCNKDLEILTYIIGDEASALSTQAIYTVNSTEISGYISKLKISSTGKYTVLYIGTSDGHLVKLNVNSQQAGMFETRKVDQGHPITGIHVEADGKIQYVMSDRKILRYEITDCDMYSTCEETIKANNPLCGWCVYENKSSFRQNAFCPYQSYNSHWLSSLTNCLSLDIEPRGVAIGKTVRVMVSVKDSLPQQFEGDRYECRFIAASFVEVSVAIIVADEGPFECKSPHVREHTDAKFEFYVKHNDTEILLADTSFLLFDCGHYKKCGECTGDYRASCSWDSLNVRCVAKNTSSIRFLQQNDSCPQLQNKNDKYYIPSDVSKTLTFTVSNIVKFGDLVYHCRLNGNVIPAAKINESQISCTAEVHTGSADAEYKIEILYGPSTINSAVMDGENTVIVYNCTSLGDDCSTCRSLKYRMGAYECDWCSNACVHPASICSDRCSPPIVTKVVPSQCGTGGNITVTIYGRELGSRYEEVDNITLAGVPCQPQPQDFSPSVRVTCIAGGSYRAVAGIVTVDVNNQRSSKNIIFSYKMPVISQVIPTQGPEAGGTRLTITGEDLGVGTRIARVYVKNAAADKSRSEKECIKAKVQPSVPYELHTGVAFWIECDTPAAEVGYMLEGIEIIFDGGTVASKAINFTYITNPEIQGIRPVKGIARPRYLHTLHQEDGITKTYELLSLASASGGNRLTITGRELKNAFRGFVTGEEKTTYCSVESSTEMVCPVPELSVHQKDELIKKVNSSLATDGSITSEIIVHLDGVQRSFSIWYYMDPTFDLFDGENEVKLYSTEDQALVIKGSNINLVAEKSDVSVTVGVDNCEVVDITRENISCIPPPIQPVSNVPGSTYPEVNVTIGNVHVTVGYIQYVVEAGEQTSIVITVALVCSLVVIITISVVFLVIYKRTVRKMNKYQKSEIQKKEGDIQGNIELHVTTPTSSELDTDMQLVLKDHNLLIDRNLLQLGDLLGKGHFGSVYKGYLTMQNQDTPTLVAVKTLHHNDPRQIDVQGFVDEAFVMKDFTHSRVLSLTGICLGMDHMPLVVLPYMKNGDLLKFIRDEKHTPSVRDLINFGIDISEGMSYLSGLKFVHRDLAARNCMLDDNFRVTVADFGLSRDIYEKEYYYCENKKTMLPVKWMALECLEKGKYSTKSDVWSFGIVLWELFTRGNHPYPDVDNWDIVRYLRQGRRLAQPQFCPDEMYKLMRECWLPNQSDRPEFSKIEQTIKDILAELEQGITQGEETKNIQTTYVNLETCTKCLYTNELMAPPDEDGILDDSGHNGNEEDPSSTHTYQDLEYPESAAAGYEELQARFCESAIE